MFGPPVGAWYAHASSGTRATRRTGACAATRACAACAMPWPRPTRRLEVGPGHAVQPTVDRVDEEFAGPRVDGPGDEDPVGARGAEACGPLRSGGGSSGAARKVSIGALTY